MSCTFHLLPDGCRSRYDSVLQLTAITLALCQVWRRCHHVRCHGTAGVCVGHGAARQQGCRRVVRHVAQWTAALRRAQHAQVCLAMFAQTPNRCAQCVEHTTSLHVAHLSAGIPNWQLPLPSSFSISLTSKACAPTAGCGDGFCLSSWRTWKTAWLTLRMML